MRTGGAELEAVLLRHGGDVRAKLPQRHVHVARRTAHRRRDLEHGLHELGVDPRLELAARHRGEHGVDVLDEVVRLGVEEHVLLLDAEREGIAVAEVVVEHAAARGWVDLLHAGGKR